MPDQTNSPNGDIIGLDIGAVRVGVARAHSVAKLPEPLPVILNDDNFLDNLKQLIGDYSAIKIVIGLPRNASGQETAQTESIRQFANQITSGIQVPVEFVDESYTSADADVYLKNHKDSKFDQDSIAACYILDEYFKING